MQFICVMPKHGSNEHAVGPDANSRIGILQERVEAAYAPFVGAGYDTPHRLSPSARSAVLLSIWDRGNGEVTRNFHSSGNVWVATAGQGVAAALHRDVRLSGGRLQYVRPVWGSYVALRGERYMNRVVAWGTAPGLEAVHYGENSDYVFVSNRPLLVALALAEGHTSKLGLSKEFLTEYLAYGYSVSGKTPFEGVATAPVNTAVAVVDGQVLVVPAPSGLDPELDHEHTLYEGAGALAAALTRAMDRTQAELGTTNVQLRLSGGKDSRLLLGLIRNRGMNVSAVTFGSGTDAESTIAARAANAASISHTITLASSSNGNTLEEKSLQTILECGGIPPSEPHLLTTAGACPERLNDAIMLGHWPLYKGGMARKARYQDGEIEDTLFKQIAPLVHRDIAAHQRKQLSKWATRVHAGSALERLYLFAREFRSGPYLHSHVSHYSRDAVIAYPISDSEVTAVCDRLTMFEKVSEKALFLAMKEIWSDALSIPLHGSKWRFEAQGPSEISGDDYYSRSQPHGEPRFSETFDGAAPYAYTVSIVSRLCRNVLGSPHWLDIEPQLSDSMRTAVTNSARAGERWAFGAAEPDMSIREFAKCVWRIYAAERWLSKEWLRA